MSTNRRKTAKEHNNDIDYDITGRRAYTVPTQHNTTTNDILTPHDSTDNGVQYNKHNSKQKPFVYEPPNVTTPLKHSYSSILSGTPVSDTRFITHSHSSTPLHNAIQSNDTVTVEQLYDMFHTLDKGVIDTIYNDLQHNVQRAIEFLLTHTDLSNTNNDSVLSAAELNAVIDSTAVIDITHTDEPEYTGMDYLTTLSDDILLPICEYLDLFDLARFALVCRDFYGTIKPLYSKITNLSMSRYTTWSNQRILNMIECFHSLNTLSLRNCNNFTDYEKLPHVLFGSELRELNLSQCVTNLSDSEFLYLVPLQHKLHRLILTGCHYLTDDTLELISHKCTQLIELSINDNLSISVYGVQRLLDYCKSLRKLDVRNTRINNDALRFNVKDNKLHHLNISNCKRFHCIDIQQKYCYLQSLTAMDLVNLKHVTIHCNTLEYLNLSQCKQVTHLSLHCSALKQLNLTGCISLIEINTDNVTTQLTHIYLSQCRALTTTSFTQLIAVCTSTLQLLNCTGLQCITDSIIPKLIDTCRLLTVCDISGCKHVTNEGNMLLQHALKQRNIANEIIEQEQKSHWWL